MSFINHGKAVVSAALGAGESTAKLFKKSGKLATGIWSGTTLNGKMITAGAVAGGLVAASDNGTQKPGDIIGGATLGAMAVGGGLFANSLRGVSKSKGLTITNAAKRAANGPLKSLPRESDNFFHHKMQAMDVELNKRVWGTPEKNIFKDEKGWAETLYLRDFMAATIENQAHGWKQLRYPKDTKSQWERQVNSIISHKNNLH